MREGACKASQSASRPVSQPASQLATSTMSCTSTWWYSRPETTTAEYRPSDKWLIRISSYTEGILAEGCASCWTRERNAPSTNEYFIRESSIASARSSSSFKSTRASINYYCLYLTIRNTQRAVYHVNCGLDHHINLVSKGPFNGLRILMSGYRVLYFDRVVTCHARMPLARATKGPPKHALHIRTCVCMNIKFYYFFFPLSLDGDLSRYFRV